MSLSVHRIDEPHFDLIQEEWNALLARSAFNNVFLRYEWIHTWWTHFRSNRTLFLWEVREDDRLVALAPFYIEQSVPLGPRYLKFCSDELSPDYVDVIIESGKEGIVLEALMKEIQRHAQRWDIVDWQHLRSGAFLLRPRVIPAHYGYSAQMSNTCPYIRIASTYAEYCQTIAPPGLREFHLNKKQRKLFQNKGVSRYRVSRQEELPQAVDWLFLLHEKRAQAIQRVSCFARPDVKRFHLSISRRFLEAGILNLQFLRCGDQPISAGYGFDYDRKVYFFQNGFDPAWKTWSPGAVMLGLMVEDAFLNGFEEFDFLKGDEAYKSLWTDTARQIIDMRAYNRTLRGSLGYAAARSKTVLRNLKATMSLSSQRMIRGFS
jgi:CelD/BcsL family acetyltransferase involved in cellulose biosynthesis